MILVCCCRNEVTADSACFSGLSMLARKNFSSSARCSGDRLSASIARICLSDSGNFAPSSLTVAGGSDVIDNRKRPMLCWLSASCFSRTVRVALAGTDKADSTRNMALV